MTSSDSTFFGSSLANRTWNALSWHGVSLVGDALSGSDSHTVHPIIFPELELLTVLYNKKITNPV